MVNIVANEIPSISYPCQTKCLVSTVHKRSSIAVGSPNNNQKRRCAETGRSGGGEKRDGALTHLVEGEVACVVPGERSDAAHGELGGVVEVVDDDGAEACEQQLQHGVAADVARPAGHQHRPRRRRHAGARRGHRLLHRHRSRSLAPEASSLPLPASRSTRARAPRGRGKGGEQQVKPPAALSSHRARIWSGACAEGRRGSFGVQVGTCSGGVKVTTGTRAPVMRRAVLAGGAGRGAHAAVAAAGPRPVGRGRGVRWFVAGHHPGVALNALLDAFVF